MALTITCKRCKEPISADDEDDLMAQVEAHARDHGGARGRHVPSRERILAHLRQRAGEAGEPLAQEKAEGPPASGGPSGLDSCADDDQARVNVSVTT